MNVSYVFIPLKFPIVWNSFSNNNKPANNQTWNWRDVKSINKKRLNKTNWTYNLLINELNEYKHQTHIQSNMLKMHFSRGLFIWAFSTEQPHQQYRSFTVQSIQLASTSVNLCPCLFLFWVLFALFLYLKHFPIDSNRWNQ